jgi:hypothetical protein
MGQPEVVTSFLDAAQSWLCDSYYVDVRYIAELTEQGWTIWSANVGLFPVKAEQDYRLKITSGNFMLGQHQALVKKATALRMLQDASRGVLKVHGRELTLPSSTDLSYYSEMQQRNRWFCDLHLQVQGDRRPPPSPIETANIDNQLRVGNVPFDGIEDAAGWLHLATPWSAQPPSIAIRVGPPVDLIFDRCSLREDGLSLVLKAHRRFDTSKVGLALRAVPGDGLKARRQIAGELAWQRDNAFQTADVSIPIDRADNALAILMIDSTVVRRQWFIDSARARNNRYFAMQHFDSGLRMVRKAVLEGNGREFEGGVSALLFMLGFGACVPIETDAPDLIVITPLGRLVLVECTAKLSDVMAKLGKLAFRKS